MRTYNGRRTSSGSVSVWVEHEDGSTSPLRHVVRHSPTGLEWGYGGSGPADLALSILHDLGGPEAAADYQALKWDLVANLPSGPGEWSVDESALRVWLAREEGQKIPIPFEWTEASS